MSASEFLSILKKLEDREPATLIRNIDGIEYVRRFLPKNRLILLGGGHISYELCKVASGLDFDITVVDDRPSFANPIRFPEASQVICDSFEKAISKLNITDRDYVCALTRGHRWDKECVSQVLRGDMPFYLGMIGSKKRVAGLKESLHDEGYEDEKLAKLHSPIGLSIGAVTPAEIAISICAELISCRSAISRKKVENELAQTNTDYEALDFLAHGEENRAMIMVISSSGSTPVKSGSLMAIDSLSRAYGTIGGGCSEAAAIVNARRLLGTGKSRVYEIDMSNDAAAEEGMVCGGMMKVLIEDIKDGDLDET